MKKIYLFLLLLLASVTGYATHIVGGDLRVVFRSQSAAGPIYRVVANIYHRNASTASLSQSYDVQIFRKRNNTQIATVRVELRSFILAPYPTDNQECGLLSTKTGVFLYDKELVLDPAIYNDVEGYYGQYTDCCRISSTTNIQTDDSFTFYVEFPRITNAAVAPFVATDAFVSSSPEFRILQGAYLCVGQPFSNDFSAIDVDGDVLTYDLVEPLATGINAPCTWLNTPVQFSLADVFGAASPAGRLKINPTTGILTVTPGFAGTFAFAVRCIETRNGIKIGEIRREFQYLVRNDCGPIVTPIPQLPPGNIVGGVYILDLNNGPSLDFIIKGSLGRKINKIDIIPVSANFTSAELDVNKIFSPNPSSVGVPLNPVTGEGKVKLTWPPCLYSKSVTDIYEFDLVLFDDRCPVSNTSTARIKLKVLQRNNPAPKWEIINTKNIALIDQNGSINVTSVPILATGQDTVRFTVVGRDAGDSLRIRARAGSEGEYFTFTPKNIRYTSPSISKDFATAEFIWVPQCSLVRNNGRKEELVLDIFIEERASCEKLRTTVKAKLILEDNGVTADYQPINVFTPNGDGKNEEYTLPKLRNQKCLYTFKKIIIHNRYGKEVFQSGDEKFAWNAEDYPTGLYYYRIEYENYEYKGSLQVLR